jgi:mono/diheme cytochrome c family protein
VATERIVKFTFVTLFFVALVCPAVCPQGKSTVASPPDPQTIANGKSAFRMNCSFCHGLHADGGFRAPSLISGHLSHGDSDDAMLNNILHGIPGTAMPANDLDEPSVRDIIAYLHSLQKPATNFFSVRPTARGAT